ncbi:MAG: hypothetical protein ACLFVA_03710 [Dehalococcoidia bacterium]
MRQYVTDENGERKAVILDFDEFERLVAYIEEMEDALDLKRAIEAGGEFMELEDFRNELRRESRI